MDWIQTIVIPIAGGIWWLLVGRHQSRAAKADEYLLLAAGVLAAMRQRNPNWSPVMILEALVIELMRRRSLPEDRAKRIALDAMARQGVTLEEGFDGAR